MQTPEHEAIVKFNAVAEAIVRCREMRGMFADIDEGALPALARALEDRMFALTHEIRAALPEPGILDEIANDMTALAAAAKGA